ncbi:MAG: hypothetical protein U1E26_05605 [Coriobacteriia bacterium]|nr:hypothetical protein [Coriobacteriia bacterium]
MSTAAPAALVLGAALLGALLPWLFMRMLEPALATASKAAALNYRGTRVHLGLGVVWLIWAGAAIVGGIAAAAVSDTSVLRVLTLAGPLALVAFALGMVDDAFGTGETRGFRGHLGAMRRARLTTGGLKLVGIGLACLVAAAIVSQVAPWGTTRVSDAAQVGVRFALTLVAGAAIALTSNFVNLMDLRPGRALKTYSLLALVGVASTVMAALYRPTVFGSTTGHIAVDGLALSVFLLGPVAAVWRSDLGERGMLGDAGANPMGAVAGMFIVLGLPVWGLLVYASLMFVANAASERVSYSRVIEANPALRWLDGLGRLGGGEPSQGASTRFESDSGQSDGDDVASSK